jgi:hypothetical protein
MQIKPKESATIAAPTSDRILLHRFTRVPESSRYPLPFDSLNLRFSKFYVLLTVHLDAILGNDQLDALFLNVFILCLYMFRAASAHHLALLMMSTCCLKQVEA